MTTYPLARDGIYSTIQGEGSMLGVPMTFVRLAGCSVGCAGCDTNYSVVERVTLGHIAERLDALKPINWIWITGGEPADHDLLPLIEVCRDFGRIAVATSGTKLLGAAARFVEFLSVSPHKTPRELLLTRGHQLNLVPGLNGLELVDWEDFDTWGFEQCYVTPNSDGTNLMESIDFVKRHDHYRLGMQAHKHWGLP